MVRSSKNIRSSQLDYVRGIVVPQETVCFRGPIPLNSAYPVQSNLGKIYFTYSTMS